MKKPTIEISDDYAVSQFGDYSFYYGYEQEKCGVCGAMNCKIEDHDYVDGEWCFVADIKNEEIIIPGSKIGLSMDGMEMSENLLKGIMWLFAKYDLKKKPEFRQTKNG